MPDMRVMAPAWIVDRRARQRAGAGQALEKSPAEIGNAFGQALAVIVERLAGISGNRFGNRKRLQQAQQRNRNGTAQ